MAIARKNIVDKEMPGFYHCTNRCVRRAFLCGIDKLTGYDCSHRKSWLENRMKSLCDIFAVEIFAFAVMDNHYHIVLYVDPKAPEQWSDEEVAERWLQVYPSRLDKPENATQREMKKQAIIHDCDRLALYRERLGDLSWYMRRLNEPLAKLSNSEENCTGRFWEGRYSSQALLDEAAVFSCMAYVDLNPVRARITEKLEESDNTSIKQRIKEVLVENDEETKLKQAVTAVTGKIKGHPLPINLKEYIELVEWTGKTIIHPSKARIPPHVISVLQRLNLQQGHWLKHIEHYGKHYCRVVGPINKIREKAKRIRVRCLQGVSAAKLMYVTPG